MSIKDAMEQSFEQYAGMTIIDRAICDARDMLKPSARMSMYAQYLEKITADKPHKKSQKSVAAAMDHFYVHGDMALYPMLARLGKPFAMRYVLEDFQGNTGTIEESSNEAASRYTEMRLARLAGHLFDDIEKETIIKWFDSYTGEEQYPAVLPSKGFYNIVNGTSGIATGISASIPQFNLKEVNEALIKLLNNPDISDDEILCMPDFTGGGILLNAKEVRESLKHGTGASCKLRARIEYDRAHNRLIITETPYGIYTSTILKQLKEIAQSDDNPGIIRPLDFSGTSANLEIEVDKKSNVDKIIKYLYKNTYIQYHYPINMVMLDNGKVPKVFSWRAALQAHLDHEKCVYRRGYEYDVKKLKHHAHILDGYLICLARIEEVVQTIKSSASTTVARENLIKEYLLDNDQASAVLKLTLSRLAHLEVEKIRKEKVDTENEIAKIEEILGNEKLLNAEIEKGLKAVATKYGDARRTQIMNIEGEDDEPLEVKTLQLSLTNQNNIFVTETSSLYTQKRNGVGAKIKLDSGEYVISSKNIESNEEILFFAQSGNFYHYKASNLTSGVKISLFSITALKEWETICAMTSINKKNTQPYILFFTKNGLCKKSDISEYNINRNGSLKAITLDEGDEIINVLFTDKENVGILTAAGNFLMIGTEDIRAIGRIARGIKAIKLADDDTVVAARIVPKDAKSIISVSGNGLIKSTKYADFVVQTKNTKGAKIQKLGDTDWMADFIPVKNEKEVLVVSTHAALKFPITEVPELSKGAIGNKSIKLLPTDNVVNLSVG